MCIRPTRVSQKGPKVSQKGPTNTLKYNGNPEIQPLPTFFLLCPFAFHSSEVKTRQLKAQLCVLFEGLPQSPFTGTAKCYTNAIHQRCHSIKMKTDVILNISSQNFKPNILGSW